MAYNMEYPYTDIERHNSDWLLRRVYDLCKEMDEFVSLNTLKWADPPEWNITMNYPKNTLVMDNDGNTYLSKQPVPPGIDITNEDYWVKIGNFSEILDRCMQGITYSNDKYNTGTSVARNVGDLVWWHGKLYEVIQPMTAGQLYYEDVNIQRVCQEIINHRIFDDINLERSGVAWINSGANATKNYYNNELFWWNGEIYKAIGTISTGDVLTEGANCQKYTVERRIKMEEDERNEKDNWIRDGVGYRNDSTVALKSFHDNELFWMGGKLYKTIGSVTAGTTWNVGANCQLYDVCRRIDMEESERIRVDEDIREGVAYINTNNTTASKAYVDNELFWRDTVLYKAIGDIPAGTAFTGTNCQIYNVDKRIKMEETERIDKDHQITGLYVESTNTATHAYKRGDYFWWKNDYVRAIHDIPNGTAITTANVEKTGLAKEMKELLYKHEQPVNESLGKIVCIGDSYLQGYGAGVTTNWGNELASFTGHTVNTDLFEFALGGSGFNASYQGKDFEQLTVDSISNANLNTAEKRRDVKYVIYVGGANERLTYGAGVVAKVKSCIETCYNYYPNARIMVFYGSTAGNNQANPMHRIQIAESYQTGCAQTVAGIYCGSIVSSFLKRRGEYMINDFIHPNNKGQKELARAISTIMKGGRYEVFEGLKGLQYGLCNTIENGKYHLWSYQEVNITWTGPANYNFTGPMGTAYDNYLVAIQPEGATYTATEYLLYHGIAGSSADPDQDGNSTHLTNCHMAVRLAGSTTWYNCDCVCRFRQNTIELYPVCVQGNGYLSGQVVQFQLGGMDFTLDAELI